MPSLPTGGELDRHACEPAQAPSFPDVGTRSHVDEYAGRRRKRHEATTSAVTPRSAAAEGISLLGRRVLRRVGPAPPTAAAFDRLVSLREVGIRPPAEGAVLSPSLTSRASIRGRPAADADEDEDIDVACLLHSSTVPPLLAGQASVREAAAAAEEVAAAQRLLDGLDEGLGWSVPMAMGSHGSPYSNAVGSRICRSPMAPVRHPLADVLPSVASGPKVYVTSRTWFSS